MKTELVTLDFNGRAAAAYLIDDQQHALTDEQAGTLLRYADPAKGIQNLVARDEHGELDGLSVTLKLRATDGKAYNTRVWGRDGVIALGQLCATEMGPIVRKWARKALLEKIDGARISGSLPVVRQVREARTCFRSALGFARDLGLDGNQATLNALRITKDRTGFDAREEFQLQLAAPVQTRYLTPTEIGRQLNPARFAVAVNQLLEEAGYQTKTITAKGRTVWVGAEEHQDHWMLVDEARANAGGNVQVLRWHESVLPLLQARISAEAI